MGFERADIITLAKFGWTAIELKALLALLKLSHDAAEKIKIG